MTTTPHLHSALADRKFGVNGASFFLASPIIVPNPMSELHVSLSQMQIPFVVLRDRRDQRQADGGVQLRARRDNPAAREPVDRRRRDNDNCPTDL